MHNTIAILLWIMSFTGTLVSVVVAVVVGYRSRIHVVAAIIVLFTCAILVSYAVGGLVGELIAYSPSLFWMAWSFVFVAQRIRRWLRKHRLQVATGNNSDGGR